MALEAARLANVLTLWRPDRLPRSLPHLILPARKLEHSRVALISAQDKIDTSPSGGRLVFHMFGALADDGESGIMRCLASGPERSMAWFIDIV